MHFHPAARKRLAIIVIAGCLLVQLFISHRLWFPAGRSFPLVPAFDFLPLQFGLPAGGALVAFLAGCLVFLLFRPQAKLPKIFFLLLTGLLVLEDISRLQPWLFLFGLLLLFSVSRTLENQPSLMLSVYRLVLAGTYFWSGLQKLNPAFGSEVLPWLAEPFGLTDFLIRNPYHFIFPGLLEALAGLLLLCRKSSIAGALLAGAMHLQLLFALGPFGQNWNLVVLPWNVAMLLLLFLVLPKNGQETGKLWARKTPEILIKNRVFWLAVLLVWVLPALNFFGLWDYHLSGSLYAGINPEAVFYYPEKERENLPPASAKFQYFYPETSEEFIALESWFMAETQVPFYPEQRYFKQVGRMLCQCLQDHQKAGIRILEKERFSSREKLQEFSCEELLSDH